MKIQARLYFIEIFKGLKFTLGKLLYNLTHRSEMPVIEYPEQRRPLSARFRGLHRLVLRPEPEGEKPRCVACMLCATACPAECIHIEASEEGDKSIEKFPIKFDIDLLRCVFCGFCVEACPCDAIRMDTGKYELAAYDRASLVITKEQLMGLRPMPGHNDANVPRTLPGLKSPLPGVAPLKH